MNSTLTTRESFDKHLFRLTMRRNPVTLTPLLLLLALLISGEEDITAVVVSSSCFWFNYRFAQRDYQQINRDSTSSSSSSGIPPTHSLFTASSRIAVFQTLALYSCSLKAQHVTLAILFPGPCSHRQRIWQQETPYTMVCCV